MVARYKLLVFAILAVIVVACNDGLRPSDSIVNAVKVPVDTTKPVIPTGFSGIVTFRGTRPVLDSLLALRMVVLTRKRPINLDSLLPLYNKEMFLGDSLSRFADTLHYLDTVPPGTYGYIVIAQQYSTAGSLFGSWRAAGVYAPSGNDSVPGVINVIRDSVIGGVNIVVDYDHLPPQ